MTETPQMAERTRKWWVFVSIGVGTFMSALDGSVVNSLLPVMRSALRTSVSEIEWVVTVYLLVVSGLLLVLLPGGGLALRLRPGRRALLPARGLASLGVGAGARLLLLRLLLGRDLVVDGGMLTLGELELLREVGVAVDVAHVEEGRLLQPDVDEGRLHAGQDPDHAPLVDVADDALLALSLEVELVDGAALYQRDAGLCSRCIDDEDARPGHVGPRWPGRGVREGCGAAWGHGPNVARPGGAGHVQPLVELALTSASIPSTPAHGRAGAARLGRMSLRRRGSGERAAERPAVGYPEPSRS